MLKGNKGEWSELYVFLKLLEDEKVFGADQNLEKLQDALYVIREIIRGNGEDAKKYRFFGDEQIEILDHQNQSIAIVDAENLKGKTKRIFEMIKNKKGSSFEIPLASEVMDFLRCNSLKASSSKKTDIKLCIYDPDVLMDQEVGFSIKSNVGADPTLLNASGHTNFLFRLDNTASEKSKEDFQKCRKFSDKFQILKEQDNEVTFYGMSSSIFEANLKVVDTILPIILGEMLLEYYQGSGQTLDDILRKVVATSETLKAFKLDYVAVSHKVKNFLLNIALGMMPGVVWDGRLESHGGYLILREDGEVVCFHIYNFEHFRDYLYNNVRFETPSKTRWDFGYIYEEDGRAFIKLNLQIRFK